jgi:hypothetical protein
MINILKLPTKFRESYRVEVIQFDDSGEIMGAFFPGLNL